MDQTNDTSTPSTGAEELASSRIPAAGVADSPGGEAGSTGAPRRRPAAGEVIGEFLSRVAVRSAAMEFLRDKRGGAMLVAGIGAATIMVAAGAGLVNLAWHETHREELRAAMRAAVASVGASLLARAGDGGAVDQAIAERVDAFVEASTGATVDAVTVDYDDGRIGVGIEGELGVDALWNVGGGFFDSFDENIAVRLDSTKHEFALALDITRSMNLPYGTGTRMDGLKAALATVASNLEDAQRDSPAGMMVAVVPYASAVRVADTAGPGASADKTRYLRMMGGRANAKWVDIYHHYGVGGTHEIAVPAGFDWDENRFTGCFMARWGAYWNAAARPAPMAWPATLNNEPLHLSDAPPDPANANTLFTPYSWPDAGPAGNIDARLQWAMAEILGGASLPCPTDTLTPTECSAGVRDWYGDNDWSAYDGRGDALCPEVGVLPLTDDVAVVRRTVNALRPIDFGPGLNGRGATYAHLGIVWGMRLLSSGWQDVWNTRDFRNARRPAPAAADLHKTILVVSDGAIYSHPALGQLGPQVVADAQTSSAPWGRVAGVAQGDLVNPNAINKACPDFFSSIWQEDNNKADPPGTAYESATALDDAAFNALFPSDWRMRLAEILGVASLAAAIGGFDPVDAFRGTSAGFADALAAAGLPRPTQVRRHLCDFTSDFGPYGRLGDPLYVGGDPVFDGSPWPARDQLTSPYSDWSGGVQTTKNLVEERLYEWWDAACAIAATRNVTVHAVFIGNDDRWSTEHIGTMRACTDSTGGETFVAPDAATLDDALDRLIRLQRTLRFVD